MKFIAVIYKKGKNFIFKPEVLLILNIYVEASVWYNNDD